jgi:parvulin-like peptidyl-prolyl isomerase
MITVIRKRLQGSVNQIITWLIILVLAIGYLPSFLRKTAADGSWAILVNKQEVGLREFRREVGAQKERIALFRAQYGQYADFLFESMGYALDPQRLAFERLVKDELISQVAQAIPVYLSEDYISRMIGNQSFIQQEFGGVIPPFIIQEDGSVDQAALRNYLRRAGMSIGDFEQSVEQALARNLVVDLVKGASYVPEFDLKQNYMSKHLPKKFSILTLSFDDYLKSEKTKPVTDEDLKAFFDKNSRAYRVPEKRSAVVWKMNPYTYGIAISDEQLEREYDKGKKSNKFIDQPAQVQVRKILFAAETPEQFAAVRQRAEQVRSELLNDPSQFEAVASSTSDDNETKSKGGLVPYFSKGQNDVAFERAAFTLKEPGNISDVVQTNEGLVLIQLVDKKAKTFKVLSAVKNEIKEDLIQKEFKKVFTQDMKKIAQDEEKLAELVATKKGKKESKSAIVQDESRLAKELFRLNEKNNKVAFYVEGGEGFVVKLDTISESYLPALDDIKEQVTQDLYEQNAKNALSAALKKAHSESKTVSFDELKKTYSASLEHTDLIKPNDEKGAESLSKKGLSVDQLFQLEKVGATLVHETGKNGYLVRLDEVGDFDLKQYVQDRGKMKASLQAERERLLGEGFVASLYRNATIETNESLVNTVQ